MKRKILLPLVVITYLFACNSLVARDGGGSRSSHRFGVTLGIFSDPFPNLAGVSLRYNLTDFFQIHAGYGYLSFSAVDASSGATYSLTTKSYGGGARLFVPGWSFSPFFGFNYSKWDATGNVTLGGQTIDAGAGLPGVMYLTFGLDWQTHGGFNFGFGAHYILSPAEVANALQISPQIYLGWYF